jgi:hypothetical protein
MKIPLTVLLTMVFLFYGQVLSSDRWDIIFDKYLKAHEEKSEISISYASEINLFGKTYKHGIGIEFERIDIKKDSETRDHVGSLYIAISPESDSEFEKYKENLEEELKKIGHYSLVIPERVLRNLKTTLTSYPGDYSLTLCFFPKGGSIKMWSADIKTHDDETVEYIDIKDIEDEPKICPHLSSYFGSDQPTERILNSQIKKITNVRVYEKTERRTGKGSTILPPAITFEKKTETTTTDNKPVVIIQKGNVEDLELNPDSLKRSTSLIINYKVEKGEKRAGFHPAWLYIGEEYLNIGIFYTKEFKRYREDESHEEGITFRLVQKLYDSPQLFDEDSFEILKNAFIRSLKEELKPNDYFAIICNRDEKHRYRAEIIISDDDAAILNPDEVCPALEIY